MNKFDLNLQGSHKYVARTSKKRKKKSQSYAFFDITFHILRDCIWKEVTCRWAEACFYWRTCSKFTSPVTCHQDLVHLWRKTAPFHFPAECCVSHQHIGDLNIVEVRLSTSGCESFWLVPFKPWGGRPSVIST